MCCWRDPTPQTPPTQRSTSLTIDGRSPGSSPATGSSRAVKYPSNNQATCRPAGSFLAGTPSFRSGTLCCPLCPLTASGDLSRSRPRTPTRSPGDRARRTVEVRSGLLARGAALASCPHAHRGATCCRSRRGGPLRRGRREPSYRFAGVRSVRHSVRGPPLPLHVNWSPSIDRTWRADATFVQRMDDYVRVRLAEHRRIPINTIAPGVTSVNVLAKDVRRFGDAKRWFWTVAGIGLLAELLLCAEKGTPQPRHAIEFHERNGGLRGLGMATTPLILLRNAAVHPASTAKPKDRFVDLLVAWLEQNGETELARTLRGRWALLGSEPVARFALRRLDSAGPILKRLL